MAKTKAFSEGGALLDPLVGAGEQGRGIVNPDALGVLRLITSSKVAGCCIGRAGFAHLRILST